jgi:para-nitrobenzyl esterase
LAKGLFHKAIIESGLVSPVGHSSRIFVDRPIRDDSGNATVGTAEGDGVKLSTALGCESADDPLQCLRSKTAQELYGPRRVLVCTGMGISNGPNVDGYVIPAPVLETLKKGEQNNVPLMIGTNKDEGAGTVTEFAPFVVSMIKTDADYRLLVKTVFADKADQILARYPAADYASPNAAFEQLVSDLFFLAPARLYSRQIALKQSQLFTYQFTHVLKGTPLARLGAYHSAELNYVFYNFDVYPFTDGIKPKQKEFKLGDSMVAYWTNFAKHGDPNDGKLPQWPAYTLDGDTTILLDTKIRTAQGLRKDYADFLAQLFVTDTSFTTPCDKGN